MSLEELSQQLKRSGTSKERIPPVELWDPPYCGEIDIQITADGRWLYQGSEIKRISLVKLFASVLKKEGNDYFLVTPVEKVKIVVDDAPLILTQWQWQDSAMQAMEVTTNLDDVFIMDSQHPLTIDQQGQLYVNVRRNLLAKVHRNVYYQWIDIAKERTHENRTELMFTSQGYQFSLGYID